MTRQDDFKEEGCPGLRAEKPAGAHTTCECRARLAADDERARILAYLYRAQEEWETALQHESRKAEADDIRKGAHTRTAFEGELS